MDADFKSFSLSALYFSCGNYWTRNHTGKIFPEEPAWFNSHLPGRLRVLCKAKPQPCGDISVCRSTSADGTVGRAVPRVPCVCWGLVTQVCSWTAMLWKSQQTWAPGFGRGEVVRGCDFYFWSTWHGENKWWDGIPLCSYIPKGPFIASLLRAAGQPVRSLPRHCCLRER